MTTLTSHKSVSILLAAAVATASLLLAAASANATVTGLFQMKRIWWGGTSPLGTPDPYISEFYHPRYNIKSGKSWSSSIRIDSSTIGTGTTARNVPRFTVPDHFIKDYTWTWHCVPGTCSPGYPASSNFYSYWNLDGHFQPNNSRFGGASTATTVVFPTTMGNPTPPFNSGNPASYRGGPTVATTTPCVGGGLTNGAGGWTCGYLAHDLPPDGTPGGGGRKAGEPVRYIGGNYDMDRMGSIMITPGSNRFGGTMQFFHGPNHLYYRKTTQNYPYISKAYGPQMNIRDPHAETEIGDVHFGGPFNIYRMTTYGYSRTTTGTPYSPGGFYQIVNPYFYQVNPFTTGMVTAWQVGAGGVTTEFQLTGYDNRTPAGLNGVLSMVRPRMVHAYIVPHDVTEVISMVWASAGAWQMDFHFRGAPEPGSALMLTSGFVLLAGLYRRRRR